MTTESTFNGSRLIWVALLSLMLVPGSALATGSAASFQSALDSESGWEVLKLDGRGGVDVYKKDIAGAGIPGFRGVKIVDVDSGPLFAAIND